jgi:hypothetical protein
MKRVIEIPLADGGTTLIEVNDTAPAPASPVRRGIREELTNAVTETATQTFEAALARIKPAADAVVTQLKSLAHVPDNVEVEFGIKFGAKGNAYLAAADAEANFKVTLKWQREKVQPATA